MAGSIKILGIAGSIRKASFNRSAVRAAQTLAPEGASIEILEIDGLPGFNFETNFKARSGMHCLERLETR